MRCTVLTVLAVGFLSVIVPGSAVAVEITSLTMGPEPFSPESGETGAFTAAGTPGSTGLTVRIYPAGGGLFATVSMTESPAGTYRAIWNGKSGSGQIAWPGYWRAIVYSTVTLTNLGPWLDFTVSGTEITILSMAPNPFSPESGETATLTASGSVGGTDLVVKIRPANDGNIFANVVLSEGPEGTYTGTWDGTHPPHLWAARWPRLWAGC